MSSGSDIKGKKAALVLADGTIYYGSGFGAEKTTVGELVFSTAMTGYQEQLTDPSYAGQLLTLTYPLIGNYGVTETDNESSRIWARGLVVREACTGYIHRDATKSIDEFLSSFDVPGISGLDTRAIVRKLRNFGVMPACLSVYEGEMDVQELLAKAKAVDYSNIDFVQEVATKKTITYGKDADCDKTIVMIDCGMKMNQIREFNKRKIKVICVPFNAKPKDILSHEPDGIFISNGPGNPALLTPTVNSIRELFSARKPIFGICLGNQLLSLAAGFTTYKLKFGHRSANQPVLDVKSNLVRITSQNHGFAVDCAKVPKDWFISHINCNDGTCEGVRHKELPIFSVQYHPEAKPGPQDSSYLFDEFKKML